MGGAAKKSPTMIKIGSDRAVLQAQALRKFLPWRAHWADFPFPAALARRRGCLAHSVRQPIEAAFLSSGQMLQRRFPFGASSGDRYRKIDAA